MFSIAGVYYHYFYMLFTFNSKQLGLYSEEVKNQIKNAQTLATVLQALPLVPKREVTCTRESLVNPYQ